MAAVRSNVRQEIELKILVNHVGYGYCRANYRDDQPRRTAGFPCRAIVQISGPEDFPQTVFLRTLDGFTVGEFPVESPCRVDGWKSRRFSVVRFEAPLEGHYVLEARADEISVVSPPFRVEQDIEACRTLSDILFGIAGSRSAGVSDRADRRVPFYGGREGTVDVHGGWYDASGDTSKYLSHLSYANFMNPQQTPLVVWCLLDARDRLSVSRFPLGKRLDLRLAEEAAWGADFLMRMQDPEGYFYATVFDNWSKDLKRRQICSYRTQKGILSDAYEAAYRQGGGMAIAALARASGRQSSTTGNTGEYSSAEYLAAAYKGWRHLEEHNLEYLDDGRENIIDDFCALLAADELLIAGSGGAEGLVAALEYRTLRILDRWESECGCFRADDSGQWSWFHASDEALPLVVLMRVIESGFLSPDLKNRAFLVVDAAMGWELLRAGSVANPFLHPRRLVRMPGKPAAESFFYPHDNPTGYWWQGENARLASWAAAFRRRWVDVSGSSPGKDLADVGPLEFADAQVSWILGLNPFDACMLQGHGRNNPPYEWDHFNLPGGVANGITSGFNDENDIAFMPELGGNPGDHSWRWGEQWLPHAAWLLLAVAWSVPLRKNFKNPDGSN